ncbi:MAG: hypothetical protein ACHBN1_13555 [Heteroscytonema crispum UTEX LB 1556]
MTKPALLWLTVALEGRGGRRLWGVGRRVSRQGDKEDGCGVWGETRKTSQKTIQMSLRYSKVTFRCADEVVQ